MKAIVTVIASVFAASLAQAGSTTITMQRYGQLPDGSVADLYTLKSDTLEVSITNYGGRIVELKTPDRHGNLADVTLSYGSLEGYLAGKSFFGTLVGRFANRIAQGRFTLNGVAYQLAINSKGNALHGGVVGFDKHLWQARADRDGVILTYVSPDGEENYPGTVTATVRYSLRHNELHIDYRATTDKDTVVNLTNHSYFNLAADNQPITGHELTIYADRFTPIDATLIPTGELRSVVGTPLDFRQPHTIGERINDGDAQIHFASGYDHNWVLNGKPGKVTLAASIYEPNSGRVMQVLTDQPGLQMYTGNFLDGSQVGRDGQHYGYRSGFTMESQHFPDSPNQPGFPTTTLKPGQPFQSTTVFRFTTRN
jgi:aldose 1-epimerase